MPNDNKAKIEALLEKTAAADSLAGCMLHSHRNTILTPILQVERQVPSRNDARMLRNIMEGMCDFVRALHAPPSLRQKYWDACDAWLARIARELGTSPAPDLSEIEARPMESDTMIALIKALHSEKPKTQQELGEDLGVTDRTIRTNLRMLCPALQRSDRPVKPLRICGQMVRVSVTEETVEREDQVNRRTYRCSAYRTPDRLHPLFLQQNTMQTAHLLKALQRRYDQDGDAVCYETALDIWCQLSDEGKNRIREVYCTRDSDFRGFIEMLDRECEDPRPIVFHTEEELQPDMDLLGLLESAFKSGNAVSLCVEKDGERVELNSVRIRWAEIGGDDWLAIPADEWPRDDNAVRFSSSEIRGCKVSEA